MVVGVLVLLAGLAAGVLWGRKGATRWIGTCDPGLHCPRIVRASHGVELPGLLEWGCLRFYLKRL